MDKKNWFRTKILGVKVDFISLERAVEWVEERVKYNKKGQIVTPNPEQVVLAKADEEFARVLNNANLAICDGVGLLWAAKKQLAKGSHRVCAAGATPHPVWRNWRAAAKIERLSGTDLMLALCQKASQKGWRVMLVGGRKGVAQKAAKQLTINNPPASAFGASRWRAGQQLTINYFSGAVDIKSETEKERNQIIKKINDFSPHLLFVAYGAPYQEKWVARNLPYLKVNVAMGVGGAFDYITGKVGRAPKWVRVLGFEWLWRLSKQPWRIKRQLNLIKFLWLVVKEKQKPKTKNTNLNIKRFKG